MEIYNQFMELRGSNNILTGRSHSFLLSLYQNPKMNQGRGIAGAYNSSITPQIFSLIRNESHAFVTRTPVGSY